MSAAHDEVSVQGIIRRVGRRIALVRAATVALLATSVVLSLALLVTAMQPGALAPALAFAVALVAVTAGAAFVRGDPGQLHAAMALDAALGTDTCFATWVELSSCDRHERVRSLVLRACANEMVRVAPTALFPWRTPRWAPALAAIPIALAVVAATSVVRDLRQGAVDDRVRGAVRDLALLIGDEPTLRAPIERVLQGEISEEKLASLAEELARRRLEVRAEVPASNPTHAAGASSEPRKSDGSGPGEPVAGDPSGGAARAVHEREAALLRALAAVEALLRSVREARGERGILGGAGEDGTGEALAARSPAREPSTASRGTTDARREQWAPVTPTTNGVSGVSPIADPATRRTTLPKEIEAVVARYFDKEDQ